ncbi:MAG TPA: hypothetical protein VFU13_21685 [Steroidobacteraceae bacterium]|nr:hypothetical protein [Steroidobacteraceae bacterium]
MRSPSRGTVLRSHSCPKIPTSASQGTSTSGDCARAPASASATVASSGNCSCHDHCRSGIANATVQDFI